MVVKIACVAPVVTVTSETPYPGVPGATTVVVTSPAGCTSWCA